MVPNIGDLVVINPKVVEYARKEMKRDTGYYNTLTEIAELGDCVLRVENVTTTTWGAGVTALIVRVFDGENTWSTEIDNRGRTGSFALLGHQQVTHKQIFLKAPKGSAIPTEQELEIRERVSNLSL
jgi:hypothetical protein